jgi:citrate synthase
MDINTGLEGVVAASTRLSHVDGERGELIIAGYPLPELAAHATFDGGADSNRPIQMRAATSSTVRERASSDTSCPR